MIHPHSKSGLWIIMICLLALPGCLSEAGSHASPGKSAPRTELVVSVAASLGGAMQELKGAYEANTKDVRILLNVASTGAIVRQIEQGAPVDLFFLASKQDMDLLVEKKLAARQDVRALLGNSLVLVVPADGGRGDVNWQGLTESKLGRIALGTPDTVPAGKYARQALQAAGMWEQLSGKFIYGQNVRQVLTYVENGDAGVGFVYATDALSSAKVRQVFAVPKQLHEPILYGAGVVKETRHRAESEQLYQYLQGDRASEIFTRHGFTIIN